VFGRSDGRSAPAVSLRAANLCPVSRDRDVGAFDRRASTYDDGPLGRWHRQIVSGVASIARSACPTPARTLDVGCGTGALLAGLGGFRTGSDAAPAMVRRAAARLGPEVPVLTGYAECLPFHTGTFDLVVSSMSFDHWADQGRGLAECARVLAPGGVLVLADLGAAWLWPATLRGRARTRRKLDHLLAAGGLAARSWHRLGPFVSVVEAG
jgi:SAM-dependent methyltransferase